MNTFVNRYVGIFAVLMLAPATAAAGGLATTACLVANGVVAQSSKPDSRSQSKRLVVAARDAMKAGKLDQADTLITEAERLNVKYSPLYFGDTPKRARRDLTKARERLQGSAAKPKLPSEQFSSSRSESDNSSARRDPFQNRGGARRPTSQPKPIDVAGAANNRPLPSADLSSASLRSEVPTAATPQNPTPQSPLPIAQSQLPTTPATPTIRTPASAGPQISLPPTAARSAQRSKGDLAIIESRRALSVGDVRRAQQHLEAAMNYRDMYQPGDIDSPDRVAASIRKYDEVMQRRKGREQSEAWRRQYAEVLMEQAEALTRWSDFAEADRLATDADRLGVKYGTFESNPKTLLERIAQKRKDHKPTPGAVRRPLVGMPGSPSGQAEVAKGKCQALMQQARASLAAGDLDRAERLARKAVELNVPDNVFGPKEDRPWLLVLDIQKKRIAPANVAAKPAAPRQQTPNAVQQAAATTGDRYAGAQQALYDQANDATYNRTAAAERAGGVQHAVGGATPGAGGHVQPAQNLITPDVSEAERLFRLGEEALRKGDKETALRHFRTAYPMSDQLDPLTRSRMQDHLQLLSAPRVLDTASEEAKPTLIDDAALRQRRMLQQLSAELARQQTEARKIWKNDPKGALELLTTARAKVEAAQVEPAGRQALLRRVDLSIKEVERYINDNQAQIELDEQNAAVRQDIEQSQEAKLATQQKVAELVDEFNKLIDEQRYEEAEVIAKRAREIAPREPVVQQLWINAKMIRREFIIGRHRDEKESAVWGALHDVDLASTPFPDNNPIVYPGAKQWSELSTTRSEMRRRNRSRKSQRELEIEQKLKTPVSVRFIDRPLAEVVEQLATLTGVNIHLDPSGLSEEGVTSNEPVTLVLEGEIMLESALNLVLEPLNLSYVIKDEVLKITSEQLRDEETYTVTYNVADLVIPIPNFVPGNHLGLQGQLSDAYAAMGYGSMPGAAPPLALLAGNDGASGSGMIDPKVLAQMPGQFNTSGASSGRPIMAGPGGLGGGAEADFDQLIELITATIQPNTWDEVGGPGSVKEFATNLSLVISQTQDVHEEIVDLLEQLRRLQDLQVTIEVRFITLSDTFFEQIGIDFDFNISDEINTDVNSPPVNPSATVGLNVPQMPAPGQLPAFTANLDIPFRQESFGLATAPGFAQPQEVAQFGFAILSDIEAFFLIRATQGDRRSNILQAPKVTLFNGQQAFVSDTTQRPFVISVIPVVGDFAAAQQPVIVVLSEGTFMTIQAVVSEDRRYVRLTVVPFFSQIGDVQEFTFEGSSSSTTASSQGVDDDDNVQNSTQAAATNRQGTTVQLPTFIFTTVTTTVSVPDGGTVLLGGIKRLSEARSEFGVPLLSKVPYVNRLFRNVGIGRQTTSLMMMVTPRIIIQEEEEEKLGIASP